MVALLSVTAVVCLTLAAHGYSAYHAASGKPTVMPLGDLVGFLVGGLLVVTVSLVVLGRVRGQRG